ncbi:MAG: hypothetical protein ABI743_03570 [bacterium]
MADFGLTVIGNTLGALLTAALAAQRGVDTALVLAGHEGFDDSFFARDVFLEGGLLISGGEAADGAVQATARELGIPIGVAAVGRPTRFNTDQGSVRVGAGFSALAQDLSALFPGDHAAIIALTTELAEWHRRALQLGIDPLERPLQPQEWATATTRDLSLTGNFGLSGRWSMRRRLKGVSRTRFASVLEHHGIGAAQRAWWEALLNLRMSHLPMAIDALSVALELGRDTARLGVIEGGLDPLRAAIIDGLWSNLRCQVTDGHLEAVRFAPDALVEIQVAGAGVWTSDQVVCDRGPLMWQARKRGADQVELQAIPGAQRHPHVMGVLVGLVAGQWDVAPSGQDWWVPRLDLPPTGANGFWITHLPAEASLPNAGGIHLATVHGAYLESQLLAPDGRLYPEDDLVRKLWSAAQHRDEVLQWPLEAFRPVLPRRVAPLDGQQTLLPDPRAAIAEFVQPGRLGPVARGWWLERGQHPQHDLIVEFGVARQMADALLALTPWERVVSEIRSVFPSMKVETREPLGEPLAQTRSPLREDVQPQELLSGEVVVISDPADDVEDTVVREQVVGEGFDEVLEEAAVEEEALTEIEGGVDDAHD